MAASDAHPVAIRGAILRLTFPLLDADGDLVAGATGLDTEFSEDGVGFGDASGEATEIATSSGMYFIDLIATETDGDTVAVLVKSNEAKTTPMVIYPSSTGNPIDVNVQQVSDDATAADNIEADYDGTGFNKSNSEIGTTAVNSDMVGTDGAALASVLGALTDAAADGDPTTGETLMQYIKQGINVLVGTAGVVTFPSAAAPGDAVSLAEIIRSIYDDSNSLDGTKIPDTLSLANINAQADTALTDFFTSAATLVDLFYNEAMVETSGAPAITGTFRDFWQFLFALSRNKILQTATLSTLRNDADAGDLSTSVVGDDGTTATRGEWSV